MNLDVGALQHLLSERMCARVRVHRRPDGTVMLHTDFKFPDGDGYPIYLSAAPAGGLRLSDRGHTLMHISYEHDIDSFVAGARGVLMEDIMNESGLQRDEGAFCFDTPPERLPEALFTFGQALTRIYGLTLLSRSSDGSTFYEDLADLLFNFVDQDSVERDYEPDAPDSQSYPVDFRIESKSGPPLFLYGVPNRDKARLTTIMLSHFHRYHIRFESLIVFQDQAAIPRSDIARLSDVGGDMISSLSSSVSFCRKVMQRVG